MNTTKLGVRMVDKMKTVRRQQGIDKHIHRWEDKVEVYGGIPMNPSYMDGDDTDRYGKRLSQSEQNSLMWYREKNREQWLKEKDND